MKHIILQGLPGIGKTTLIKKVVAKLNDMGKKTDGFYTEEVRAGRGRLGFDIVTLRNERGILARKRNDSDQRPLPQVGQYVVHIDEFEKLALPVLDINVANDILIIDEIGKMELFSKKFETMARQAFASSLNIIATVPLKGGPHLVKQLKEDHKNILIVVNEKNRDSLVDDIINLIFN